MSLNLQVATEAGRHQRSAANCYCDKTTAQERFFVVDGDILVKKKT